MPNQINLESRYPYITVDLERITVDQLREGDLLAGAGPVGCDRFLARRVEWVRSVGHDDFWGCHVYEFVLAGGSWETPYRQPLRMPVWIVRGSRS